MHDESYSLKEWLNKIETTHDRTHNAERLARDKAEEAVNRRLESMNEFRSQLDRQASLFALRETVDQQINTLRAERQVATNTVRELLSADIALLRSRVETIEKIEASSIGRSSGMNASWAIGVSAISVVVLLVNLGFFLVGK